ETLAAAGADHVDTFATGKDRHEHLIAFLGGIASGGDLVRSRHARRGHVRLLEVTRRRLVAFAGAFLDEAELHRLVAVRLGVLRLHDDAGAGLDHRRGMHGAIRVEDLRHADFLTDDACDHKAPEAGGWRPGSRHFLASSLQAL